MYYLFLDEDTAGTIDTFLTKGMFAQANDGQRCRDVVMNEFLFWCRDEVTSLHPPSFQRYDISTCYFHISDSITSSLIHSVIIPIVSTQNGDSAVIWATVKRQPASLRELVRAGSDLNLQNQVRYTVTVDTAPHYHPHFSY